MRAALLLACVLAAGCGSLAPETWSRPGATQQGLTRDVVECERAARYDPTHGQEQGAWGFAVSRDDRVFAACMRARGYERVTSPGPAAARGTIQGAAWTT